MYTDIFQEFNVESAFSGFEVLTTSIYKCNEDRTYYATKYHDFFNQYTESFTFVKSRASEEFNDVHIAILNSGHLFTPCTNADIPNCYLIPQESQVYRKLE